jgi:hypothetical protein
VSVSPLPQVAIVLHQRYHQHRKSAHHGFGYSKTILYAQESCCDHPADTMSQTSIAPIRTTQRPPRSCIPCSPRKVRCDKSVPCGTCIRRGHPEACNRELVIIRGEVTSYRDFPQLATYEELKSENERLRHEIEVIKAERSSAGLELPSSGQPDQDKIQALLRPWQKKRSASSRISVTRWC